MLQSLPVIPIDPIFKLWGEFLLDQNPQKINLGIGIYQDDHGGSYVMPVVQKAAKEVQTSNFDYVSMGGDRAFLETVAQKVLGNLFIKDQIALQQTCGGTQAVQIWGAIMTKAGYTDCLFPIPTWGNHFKLLKDFTPHTFQHLAADGISVDLENYKTNIKKAPQKSLLVLQGGLTHNPCGMNLSQKNLQELIDIIREKEISVLVDFAYLGLGESFTKDASWLQYLWSELDNVAVALSFSKNACLYRHRLGALLVKTSEKTKIESHLQVFIRESISNPPAFGAEVMNIVLNKYFDQWIEELDRMRSSIDSRKELLLTALPASYQYLKDTKGMFGLLPLQTNQIKKLKEEKGVYLLENGRINFSSLQTEKIEAVAQALKAI